MSGTSHWLSLPLGEKVHLCKEVIRKKKGILERQHSYSFLLFLSLCLCLLFSIGDCWLVQCHSGSTLPLSQNNLPNSPWAWGENWTGLEATYANMAWEDTFSLLPESGAQTAARGFWEWTEEVEGKATLENMQKGGQHLRPKSLHVVLLKCNLSKIWCYSLFQTSLYWAAIKNPKPQKPKLMVISFDRNRTGKQAWMRRTFCVCVCLCSPSSYPGSQEITSKKDIWRKQDQK